MTSPPIRALRPSSAAPSWGGAAVLAWQMSLFHSQSSLTLFVCRIPLPSERRPLGGVTRVGEGVCAAGLGGPILYFLLQPRRRPLGRMQPPDNAVSAEYCGPFSQAVQQWPFLSLQSGILFDGLQKGRAHSAALKMRPQRKPRLWAHFLRANRRFVWATQRYILRAGLWISGPHE